MNKKPKAALIIVAKAKPVSKGSKPKMTMAQYEKTPQDKAQDARNAKLGIKEGSARDKKMDKVGLASINRNRNTGMLGRK